MSCTLSLYHYVLLKKYIILKETRFAIFSDFWLYGKYRHFETIATSNLKFTQSLYVGKKIEKKFLLHK